MPWRAPKPYKCESQSNKSKPSWIEIIPIKRCSNFMATLRFKVEPEPPAYVWSLHHFRGSFSLGATMAFVVVVGSMIVCCVPR